MTPVLAAVLITVFAALGIAKIAAATPMRAAAAHLGFTTTQYRGIGALELAGALGIALGAVVTPLGGAAAIGLILLMVGAAVAHVRNRDDLGRVIVPLVVAGLALAYLITLSG